jgi:acetyl esterase/lipase
MLSTIASSLFVQAGRSAAVWVIVVALSIAGGIAAAAETAPVHIILVGDSTVTDQAGWGAGFKQFVGDGAVVTNTAVGGRSSKSFLAEGLWEKALALKGGYYLIQFGHNDQPGKGPERETDPATTYAANMARYVEEARAIGAVPVLVTSLTRRNFDPENPGRITSTLVPYVEAVKRLAAEKHVPLIDLHARSIALCEQLGPEKTAEFNPLKDGKADTSHLDARGSVVFARLVVEELRRVVPELASVLRAEPVAPPAPAAPGGPEAPAISAPPTSVAGQPQVIPLWPEGVPGLRADAAEEQIVNNRVVKVHYPTLTVYAPKAGGANGTAVVFCPGGGYVRLAIGERGGRETEVLNRAGVTVFMLKYRLVEYGHPAPLRDVLRAVRLVRSRAAEFGVKADRIGVAGGSAGGHLAACAATMWDAPEGRTGVALDAVNARPDFAVLIYPVITMEDPFAHKGSREALLGAAPAPELLAQLSLEKRVRGDMPPVFLVATMADKSVPVENSLRFYQALRDAGVPAEMHIYAAGAHGNSLDPQYGPTAKWLERMEEWMRFNGWLPDLAVEP